MRVAALISTIFIATGFAGVAGAAEYPPLDIATGWKKFCFNNQKTGLKRVCSTRAETRKHDDQSLLAAVDIIDLEGEAKKILRVTFPLGVQLAHGTRVIVDGRDPLQSPYTICTAAGCVSDHEAAPGLLDRMQDGALMVQAIDTSGKPLTVALSLTDFRAAYKSAVIETVVDEIEVPRWDMQKPKAWRDDRLRPEILQRTY